MFYNGQNLYKFNFATFFRRQIMTRIWTNFNHQPNNNQNISENTQNEVYETDFGQTEEETKDENNGKHENDKLGYLNGNEKHFTKLNGHQNEETDESSSQRNQTCFGFLWNKDKEKEFTEQSKLVLKMIYFFQVLPFYLLQFTSGMALGRKYLSLGVSKVLSLYRMTRTQALCRYLWRSG